MKLAATHKQWLIASLAAALLLGWSYWFMCDWRAEAVGQRADLAQCLTDSARIAGLRDRPKLACEQELPAATMRNAVERCVTAAGIELDKAQIDLQRSSQRLGETAYHEKPVHVLLAGARMEQVAKLAHNLAAVEQPLRARSIHLENVSPDSDLAGAWKAELVFTYLIYQTSIALKQN